MHLIPFPLEHTILGGVSTALGLTDIYSRKPCSDWQRVVTVNKFVHGHLYFSKKCAAPEPYAFDRSSSVVEWDGVSCRLSRYTDVECSAELHSLGEATVGGARILSRTPTCGHAPIRQAARHFCLISLMGLLLFGSYRIGKSLHPSTYLTPLRLVTCRPPPYRK